MGAACHGSFDGVCFLLSKGANPNIMNANGDTAMVISRPEVRGLLEVYDPSNDRPREYQRKYSGIFMISFSYNSFFSHEIGTLVTIFNCCCDHV